MGRPLVKRLGLPDPPRLVRWQPGDPLTPGPILLGPDASPHFQQLSDLLKPQEAERYHALVFDGTGLDTPGSLSELYDFFHPVARSVGPNGRVIVLGTTQNSAAQQALDGFVRSVGKEFGRGTTAQLIRLAPGATVDCARSTLEFLLSAKSAYVSGQTIVIGGLAQPVHGDLKGKVALVTGAARGIGAEIAKVLSRDGAHVICLDVPSAGHELAQVANRVRGEALQLDLTGDNAAERLAQQIKGRRGHVDIVVHNAGITRDKTLANMDMAWWDMVLKVNLLAPVNVTRRLLDDGLIPEGGRVIGVASIAGIAGNRGQTNYATSKAGVIGWVRELSHALADKAITVNAVAPGFIETAMTERMPLFVREAGRRMNSMAQGGLPVDVAETIAWLAAPGSATVTGNVVRVCGQMMLGA
jgi:3-oxoacyl-[acyl-carrier protein] reductase